LKKGEKGQTMGEAKIETGGAAVDNQEYEKKGTRREDNMNGKKQTIIIIIMIMQVVQGDSELMAGTNTGTAAAAAEPATATVACHWPWLVFG
jgi:hypothetical protein